MADIFGEALRDFWEDRYTQDIMTHSTLGGEDSIPLPYLFRNFDQMPEVERRALELARGKVLDIGCGAGGHALHLQEKGMEVTGLDSSPGCISICRERGLQSTVQCPIMEYRDQGYDTLLLPMNGIGLAGTLENLGAFLAHLASLLRPGGQILMDSSDIIYMFDQDSDGGYWIPGDTHYYGEVTFTMAYKNFRSEPFPWIYVDYNTLHYAAVENGLACELIYEGDHYEFLARLGPLAHGFPQENVGP